TVHANAKHAAAHKRTDNDPHHGGAPAASERRIPMADKTGIQWCDATFNPWHGCTKISPGCTNCYAETLAFRYKHDVWGPKAPRRFFGAGHWHDAAIFYTRDEKCCH